MTLDELFAWAYSLPEELIITIERPCQVKLTPRRNLYMMKNYEYWIASITIPSPDVASDSEGEYTDPSWAGSLVYSDGPDMHEVMQHLYDQYKVIEATWREDNDWLLRQIAEYQAKHYANV